MLEHAADCGIPGLRDVQMLESLGDHFASIGDHDGLVILMQSEQDVFWVVPMDRVSESDPPVQVLWKTGDPSPTLIDTIRSVSAFALASC